MIITHLSTDNTLIMKPTIYIGLGGTGIKAVSHTKKMYEDMYGVGNIPPHIAFLVLDYNFRGYSSSSLATSIEADAIDVPYDIRYFRISPNAIDGTFDWMFNTNHAGHIIANGAEQLRTTGRFCTELLKETIEQALQARWQQVTNFIYGVAPANVEVHIVTSLCGGTGAGSFINIAEMVQRNFGDRANIIGHGVMHGIFRAMDPCPTRRPLHHINAYSSILDLDYLMSASMDNPITFEINGATRTFTRPLFDEFFVIDNITPNGFIANEIDTLCKNIAVYLFADNLNTQNTGLGAEWWYNILNKIGWVQSLGSFQIVYKGEELSQLYANIYAEKLIGKMLQGSSDAQETTMEWITRVGLEKDLLINRISDISRIDRLREPNTDIQDTIDATKDIINSYVNNLNAITSSLFISSLIEEMKCQLKHKIEELLCEGKVEDGKQFLEYLRLTLKNFCYEMRAEADALTNYELERISQILDRVMNDYEAHYFSFRCLLFRHRRQEFLDEVNHFAKKKLKIAYEIKFREIATEALTAFIEHITAELRRIDEFTHMLHFLRNEYIKKANECMHSKENAFEYDLSTKERVEVHVDDNDVDLQAFCTKFYKPILEMDSEQAKSAIYDFAKSRPQAMQYIEKSLADVINSMSDEEFELLRDKIIRLSSPWLQINNRGQKNMHEMRPSEIMNRTFTVYCYEGDNNRLRISLSRNIMADFVQHNYGQLHQKMFVTRKDVAIIPYCIDSLDERLQDAYEIEVRSSMNGMCCNPHFDKTLFEEMRKKDFKLKPELP